MRNLSIRHLTLFLTLIAVMLLSSNCQDFNELMYEVGYSDTKAFRTIFKKITGLSPIEYKNKYNKIAV